MSEHINQTGKYDQPFAVQVAGPRSFFEFQRISTKLKKQLGFSASLYWPAMTDQASTSMEYANRTEVGHRKFSNPEIIFSALFSTCWQSAREPIDPHRVAASEWAPEPTSPSLVSALDGCTQPNRFALRRACPSARGLRAASRSLRLGHAGGSSMIFFILSVFSCRS